jgi:hypothetical protein
VKGTAVAYTLEVFKFKSGRITKFLMMHANAEIPSEETETSVCRIIPISLICTYDIVDKILIEMNYFG